MSQQVVDTVTTLMLHRRVQSGGLDAKNLVSHPFELSETMKAFDAFGNDTKGRALTVALINAASAGEGAMKENR